VAIIPLVIEPRYAFSMATRKSTSRSTTQRQTITETIRRADGPLTIDEIHKHARRNVNQLGIATVYRAVNRLLEEGAIQLVILPDGQNRYEPADRGHHHHFRCRQCGKVDDLPGCLLAETELAKLPGGYKVEDHEVTLIGLCPACSSA